MKGLYILYNFPPLLNANSIQNERLINALHEKGIKTTVVSKNKYNTIEDNKISISSRSTRIQLGLSKRFLPDLANIPDLERFNWTRKAKHILNSMQINDYNWIHTTSSPFSLHMLGADLKKKHNIPWIAQFFDPWVDNQYRNFNYNYFREIDKKYENKVAEAADIIIHSNEIIKSRWIKRYGKQIAEKIVILPFITDVNIQVNNNKDNNSKLVLVHAGGIYGQRSLDELLMAIGQIKNEIKNIEEKLEVKLIGSVSLNELGEIEKACLQNIFTVLGAKSYSIAKDNLYQADILLLIDSLKTKENVFFPSKLVEYFSYQKPIIGITPKISPSNFLLKEAGHFVVHKGEYKKLAKFIANAIENKRVLSINKVYYKSFLPNHVADKYIEYLCKFNIIKEKIVY